MDKNDVVIGITANATGVEAGVNRAKQSLAGLRTSAKDASNSLGGVGDGGEKSAKKIERDTRSMQQSLQRYIAELEGGSKKSRAYWERMAEFKGVDKNALRPLLSQLDELKRKQGEAAEATGGLIGRLGGLQAAASVALGGFAVQGVVQATKALYEASAAAERLRIGLDFASTRGSADEIAYLRKTTYDLGLQFQSTAQSYMQFQAAAKGTTLEGEKARAVFESVAKASAVMGLSAEQNSGVLLALQQMVSKGTVQAEELRGQLGERLPGAFQIAARSMGVTTAELGKMLEMGQVISEDFLPKFAAELERSLGDAPEKAAERLDASVNRVNSSWERLKQNVGDSGVSEFWSGQLNILTDAMGNFNASIEGSRAAGDGFAGQLMAAAGAALEFVNPINAISYSAQEAGNQLKNAEQRLKELKDSGAQSSSNLMLREAYSHAQRLVDKLREAKQAQDMVAGITPSAPSDKLRDQEAGNSRGNRANYNKGLFESAQFLAQRNDGITKAFTADMDGLAKAYRDGALSAAEYAAAVTEANKKRHESTAAGKVEAQALKDSTKGAKSGESAYKTLSKSIAELLEQQNLEIATGEKLTNAQKLRMKVEQDVAKSKRAGLLADLEQIEANEAWLKNSADVERSLEAQQKAREQSLKSARDTLKSMRDEEEALAYAEAANISLAQAKAELAVNQAALNYQQAIERQEAPATLAYYEEQLRLTKEIAGATGKSEVREANKKAADQAEKDWERVSQTIGDTLADYIMGGGKDAATYLKRLFSTLVLQPVVQYGVNSAMGALGMGQQGSAVNSVLGGNNVGTTVLNNAGAIGAGFQAMYGMSVGASSASLLGANAVGMVGGDALGALAAANGMWAGVATGAQAAAQSAIAANVAMEAGTAAALEAGTLAAAQGAATGAAAGASSIMSGIATAAPWIAGALALYSIAKSFDDSGTLHYGAGAVYSGGKLQTGADIYNRDTFGMGSRGEWNANAQQNASGIAASLGAALDGFAVGFGQKAGYTVATAFADDSSDDGAWGSLRIADAMGNVLVDWENSRSSKWAPKEFASGDEGYKQFIDTIAVDAKAPFLAMDIPAWSKSMIQAATDIDSLSAALTQVGTVKTVLDSLGKSMQMFADLSGDAQTTLLNTSGGIDALAQNAGSFYQGFYSEQERYENSLKQMQEVLAGLNVSIDPAMGDRAKAEFRAAVSAAFDAGQFELGAQLLGINQQFAAVADYAQKAGGAIGEVADVLSDVMRDLLDERKSLEAEMLRAQGDSAGYAAAMRAIAIDGYTEAEVAAWDYNRALEAQIGALDAASSSVLSMALSARSAAINAAQAAQSQAQSAANNGLSNLQAAVNREKTYWGTVASASQAAIGSLSSTLSLLTSNASALYATVDSVQQMQAAQGMVYVENALAAVRGGADIKGFGGLGDAIGAARSGISGGAYASEFDRQRDALVMAGQLTELGELTDLQLSVEERSLKAAQTQIDQLDQTLQYWQEALSLDQFQIDATLSVAGAVNALGPLLSGLVASVAAAKAAASYSSAIVAVTPGGEANKAALYSDMLSSGLSDEQIRNQVYQATGNYQTDTDWEYLKKLAGVPKFAAGGYHSGGLRLVGERGPELEVTGAARYWDASKTMQMMQGGGNEALVAEVRALRAEVAALRAANERTAANTATLPQMVDQFDNVTEGGNAIRSEVMA